MAKKNGTRLVQEALIPDEMSPLGLLEFNGQCAKIKQTAPDHPDDDTDDTDDGTVVDPTTGEIR